MPWNQIAAHYIRHRDWEYVRHKCAHYDNPEHCLMRVDLEIDLLERKVNGAG